MPFDPNDPSDVRTWAFGQMATRHWSGDETVAYIAKRIIWAAQKTARRQPLCALREGSVWARTAGSRSFPVALGVADPRDIVDLVDLDGEVEAVEELLVSAMTTVAQLVAPIRLCSQRKARAMLSCLARVVHAVKSYLSEKSTSRFIEGLLSHPVFLELPFHQDIKGRFENILRGFRDTGNYRRDLADAGWSCVGNDQWTEFVKAWKQEWIARSEP
jgi:hypothetical protein